MLSTFSPHTSKVSAAFVIAGAGRVRMPGPKRPRQARQRRRPRRAASHHQRLPADALRRRARLRAANRSTLGVTAADAPAGRMLSRPPSTPTTPMPLTTSRLQPRLRLAAHRRRRLPTRDDDAPAATPATRPQHQPQRRLRRLPSAAHCYGYARCHTAGCGPMLQSACPCNSGAASCCFAALPAAAATPAAPAATPPAAACARAAYCDSAGGGCNSGSGARRSRHPGDAHMARQSPPTRQVPTRTTPQPPWPSMPRVRRRRCGSTAPASTPRRRAPWTKCARPTSGGFQPPRSIFLPSAGHRPTRLRTPKASSRCSF